MLFERAEMIPNGEGMCVATEGVRIFGKLNGDRPGKYETYPLAADAMSDMSFIVSRSFVWRRLRRGRTSVLELNMGVAVRRSNFMLDATRSTRCNEPNADSICEFRRWCASSTTMMLPEN